METQTKTEHRLRLEVEVIARSLADLPDYHSVRLMLERALLETRREHLLARRRAIAECKACGFEARLGASTAAVECPMCKGRMFALEPVHEVPEDYRHRTVDLGRGALLVL